MMSWWTHKGKAIPHLTKSNLLRQFYNTTSSLGRRQQGSVEAPPTRGHTYHSSCIACVSIIPVWVLVHLVRSGDHHMTKTWYHMTYPNTSAGQLQEGSGCVWKGQRSTPSTCTSTHSRVCISCYKNYLDSHRHLLAESISKFDQIWLHVKHTRQSVGTCM